MPAGVCAIMAVPKKMFFIFNNVIARSLIINYRNISQSAIRFANMVDARKRRRVKERNMHMFGMA